MEFYIEKVYCNMKKLFKRPKIQRKLLKNSLLDIKTYSYFLREDGFDIKIL